MMVESRGFDFIHQHPINPIMINQVDNSLLSERVGEWAL